MWCACKCVIYFGRALFLTTVVLIPLRSPLRSCYSQAFRALEGSSRFFSPLASRTIFELSRYSRSSLNLVPRSLSVCLKNFRCPFRLAVGDLGSRLQPPLISPGWFICRLVTFKRFLLHSALGFSGPAHYFHLCSSWILKSSKTNL